MEDKTQDYKEVLILLTIGSLLLLANSIFSIQLFGMQYGVGAGALIQSQADNRSVASVLLNNATQIDALYKSLLESYLNVIIAFVLVMLALYLYTHRTEKRSGANRRYTLLHLTLSVIYIVLFLIIHATSPFTFFSLHLYFTYLGFLLCVFSGVYLEYRIHTPEAKSRGFRSISLNPSTPYTNIQNLREQLFANLANNIRIVDKHFNSSAISNLHRLLDGSEGRVRSVTVITSEEMLDSVFGSNYNDLKSELEGMGMDLEVKIMNRDDSTKQHERFVLDDKNAFKIPPLNIIHKKSEHVTKISHSEAERRFDYLYQNSVKFENYVVEKGRDRGA